MKLTRTARWMLSNQYRILEALYPDEAEELAKDRLAIERGYELHYGDFTKHIEGGAPSVAECKEVLDILQMFLSLKLAKDKPDDQGSLLEFRGFDNWTESKQMRYAAFCCETLGMFKDLDLDGGFDSHATRLDRYRRMLAEWHKSAKIHDLTRDDVVRIANA